MTPEKHVYTVLFLALKKANNKNPVPHALLIVADKSQIMMTYFSMNLDELSFENIVLIPEGNT